MRPSHIESPTEVSCTRFTHLASAAVNINFSLFNFPMKTHEQQQQPHWSHAGLITGQEVVLLVKPPGTSQCAAEPDTHRHGKQHFFQNGRFCEATCQLIKILIQPGSLKKKEGSLCHCISVWGRTVASAELKSMGDDGETHPTHLREMKTLQRGVFNQMAGLIILWSNEAGPTSFCWWACSYSSANRRFSSTRSRNKQRLDRNLRC